MTRTKDNMKYHYYQKFLIYTNVRYFFHIKIISIEEVPLKGDNLFKQDIYNLGVCLLQASMLDSKMMPTNLNLLSITNILYSKGWYNFLSDLLNENEEARPDAQLLNNKSKQFQIDSQNQSFVSQQSIQSNEKSKVPEFYQKIDEQEQQLKQNQKQQKDLYLSLQLAKQEIARLEELNNEMSEKLTQDQLQQKQKIEQETIDKQKLEKQLQEVRMQLEAEELQNEEFEEEILELKQSLNNSQEENQALLILKQQIDQQNSLIEGQRKTITDLKKAHQEQIQQNNLTNEETLQKTNLIIELQDQSQKMQKLCNQVITEIQELQNQNSLLQKQCEYNKNLMDESVKRNGFINQQLQDAKDNLERVMKETNEYKQKLQIKNQQLEEQKYSLKETQNINLKQQETLNNLNNKIKAYQREKDQRSLNDLKIEDIFDKLQKKTKSQKTEIEDIFDELLKKTECQKAKNQRLSIKLAEQDIKLNDHDEQIQMLRQALEESQAEKQCLEKALSDTVEQFEGLQTVLHGQFNLLLTEKIWKEKEYNYKVEEFKQLQADFQNIEKDYNVKVEEFMQLQIEKTQEINQREQIQDKLKKVQSLNGFYKNQIKVINPQQQQQQISHDNKFQQEINVVLQKEITIQQVQIRDNFIEFYKQQIADLNKDQKLL